MSNCIEKNQCRYKGKNVTCFKCSILQRDSCTGSKRSTQKQDMASDWLKRYREEGLEGLKDRPKSGRPTDISEEIAYEIKKRISIQQTTRIDYKTQIQDLIVRNSGGIRYHYTHIYRLMHKWGFKQKVPRKVHVNTASKEEKERFKKEQERYYWIFPKNKMDSR